MCGVGYFPSEAAAFGPHLRDGFVEANVACLLQNACIVYNL